MFNFFHFSFRNKMRQMGGMHLFLLRPITLKCHYKMCLNHTYRFRPLTHTLYTNFIHNKPKNKERKKQTNGFYEIHCVFSSGKITQLTHVCKNFEVLGTFNAVFYQNLKEYGVHHTQKVVLVYRTQVCRNSHSASSQRGAFS